MVRFKKEVVALLITAQSILLCCVDAAFAVKTVTTTSRSMSSSSEEELRSQKALKITGLPMGPYPIGVTTVQIDNNNNNSKEEDGRQGRGLQTEFWYPAVDDAWNKPVTKYSDYLGLETCDDPEAALALANANTAIGGYREGITIAELDDPQRTSWLTNAVRDALPRDAPPPAAVAATEIETNNNNKWPLVVFSHGSGAYRASYGFWTEFLASYGYVVAACDHPGSARFTVVNGKVELPISNRSKNEADRPLDLVQIIDAVYYSSSSSEGNKSASSSSHPNHHHLFSKVDANNVAITGMSFGGFTTAATLELQDPRVKAAVMMSGSMGLSGTRDYHTPQRKNKSTPCMVMIGTEDVVLGDLANDANRIYVDNHTDGDAYLLEITKGGHVSFTSCELYNPEYGNGINASGESKSLTKPGTTYKPMPIQRQHEIINSYGLRFLDKYLKKKDLEENDAYLSKNHFEGDGIIFRSHR